MRSQQICLKLLSADDKMVTYNIQERRLKGMAMANIGYLLHFVQLPINLQKTKSRAGHRPIV